MRSGRSLGAIFLSRTHFGSKNSTSTFDFDAVLKLKTDEKWYQEAIF